VNRSLLVAVLVFAACSKKSAGESCTRDGHCEAGYICFRGACTTPKARDENLTHQSGVAAPAEKPVVAGDRVRVRFTHGEGTIFAQCGATERLTGGGCKGGDNCRSEDACSYVRSYPGKFTEEDTLGGRWYCAGAAGTITAYALCQEARSATSTDAGGSGSGSGSGLRSP
jgi:hypothetical protein